MAVWGGTPEAAKAMAVDGKTARKNTKHVYLVRERICVDVIAMTAQASRYLKLSPERSFDLSHTVAQ